MGLDTVLVFDAVEWFLACQDLKKHASERPDIEATGENMFRLLRRHVGWRAKVGFVGFARLVEGCRDAEVAELYCFHVTREQDVFGLEVLVDNLLLMEEG